MRLRTDISLNAQRGEMYVRLVVSFRERNRGPLGLFMISFNPLPTPLARAKDLATSWLKTIVDDWALPARLRYRTREMRHLSREMQEFPEELMTPLLTPNRLSYYLMH